MERLDMAGTLRAALAAWRDEALAEGNRELAARLQRVAIRLKRRAKAWGTTTKVKRVK